MAAQTQVSWVFYVISLVLKKIPQSSNYTLIAEYCNLWRNAGDIQDSWSSLANVINKYGDNQNNFAGVAGPGQWNDPDMVSVMAALHLVQVGTL